MKSMNVFAALRPATRQTSLATSLVWTLILFTFLLLIITSGAAYLRSRSLLREQVINQMQSQLVTQLSQTDLGIKTINIRLDRVVRSPDFKDDFQQALSTDRQSPGYSQIRDNLGAIVQPVSPANGR